MKSQKLSDQDFKIPQNHEIKVSQNMATLN